MGKHTTLPPIAPSPPPNEHPSSKNPFVMPPTNELFSLRERERLAMKTERARERKLKVHEKSTYASRLNAKTAELRKQALTPDSQTDSADVKEAGGIHEDTQFVLATTRDRQLEKEDLTSYVARKREMFLVQYALGVKRDEIQKLQEIAKVSDCLNLQMVWFQKTTYTYNVHVHVYKQHVHVLYLHACTCTCACV